MFLIISMPAYNEAENIRRVLEGLPKDYSGFNRVEFLVVDDGSSDATSTEALLGGAIVVRHRTNQGVGNAFQTAVREVLQRSADVLVTIDADGQFDAGEIPALVDQLAQGADFVTGNRFASGQKPKNMSWVKYFGNHAMTRLITSVSEVELTDVSCGFRAYNRKALLHLNLFGKFTYTQESILDLAHKGLVLREVPISVRYFANRKSRVAGNIPQYAYKTSLIIFRTVRDYSPMRFFGAVGLVVFSWGICLDVVPLGNWLATGSFTPFKYLGYVGTVMNFFGIMVIALGLVTDMLDRIRLNQERILYFEKCIYFDRLREENKARHL
ncbi:MAG: glycosyltransferase family 2 protein [Proteobacteria bacterium]|nr:glycosyltransferase family 2 protein [Pseudomonadota bacterium]